MYDPAPGALDRFWLVLRDAMRREGLAGVPEDLAWPRDLDAHWRDPALLLTQTCGHPFATALRNAVQLVGTPRYAAEGCEGPSYRSFVVVRAGDPAGSLADLRGRRAAINMIGSHSGWNALRAMAAPLARAGQFFASVLETGSHHGSMRAVATGEADVAAIDCVSFALARRNRPELTAPLRILAQTGLAPGLPFITSRRTSPDDLARLRAALASACADPIARDVLIDGFDVLEPQAYDEILAMEAEAKACGYPVLA
jgi:ABC-type phosphate/phosphonate transport system substrate-binding protein